MASGIQLNSIKNRRTTPATFYWRTLWYRVSALSIHIPRQLVYCIGLHCGQSGYLEKESHATRTRQSGRKPGLLDQNNFPYNAILQLHSSALHWRPKLFFARFQPWSFSKKCLFTTWFGDLFFFLTFTSQKLNWSLKCLPSPGPVLPFQCQSLYFFQ